MSLRCAPGRAAGRVGNDTTVSNAADPLADSSHSAPSSQFAVPGPFPPARVSALRARIPHATAHKRRNFDRTSTGPVGPHPGSHYSPTLSQPLAQPLGEGWVLATFRVLLRLRRAAVLPSPRTPPACAGEGPGEGGLRGGMHHRPSKRPDAARGSPRRRTSRRRRSGFNRPARAPPSPQPFPRPATSARCASVRSAAASHENPSANTRAARPSRPTSDASAASRPIRSARAPTSPWG